MTLKERMDIMMQLFYLKLIIMLNFTLKLFHECDRVLKKMDTY